MRRVTGMFAAVVARLRSGGGFGLIELLIAMTMLSIGFVSLTGVFISGQRAIRRAGEQDTAGVLADRMLEQFRALKWDDIALSSNLLGSVDSTYSNDTALTSQPSGFGNITDANYVDSANGGASAGLCSVSADGPSVPVTCVPSRLIPDSLRGETAPDHRSYRVDTYVTWSCPNLTGVSAQSLAGSTGAPACRLNSDNSVVPLAPVKVVTIVIRDATSSTTLASPTPVYRSSTVFDRLGGSSMPALTVTATTGSTTTGSTTTGTTTTSGAVPDPPASVALVNGGGSGQAYINAGNATSISADVGLPSTSTAGNTVVLTISDGNSAHTQTYQGTATGGATTIHFTGINLQGDTDGTITFTANTHNSNGDSSTISSTATKDTVAPDAPTTLTLQNGGGTGNAYIDSSNKAVMHAIAGLDSTAVNGDTVSVTFTDGTHTTGAGTGNVTTSGAQSVTTGSIDTSSLTDGTVTASATDTDLAGNTSTAKTATFTKNTVAPTISSVQLVNGGSTAGKLEKSDTITITFSKQMSVASFCSTWSGDATSQSISGNGVVTTTLTDGTGATNDKLTVSTSSGCTFNFGSIDMGSNAYVGGGNATFSGNGGNSTTIAWNASTHALTITLGAKGGAGTLAPVASSIAVYTPNASLTDSAGNAVSGTQSTGSVKNF